MSASVSPVRVLGGPALMLADSNCPTCGHVSVCSPDCDA